MRFRGRTLLVGLGLLVMALLLLGERRRPTGPDGWGARQSGSESEALPTEFQAATFNIHGCKGLDRRRDVGRVAGCLEEFDVVGLNEVHGSLWTDPQDQVAHLADLCGLPNTNRIFAPAETQWFGAKRFGNGLLTRRPLRSWQRIPLPRRYDHSCRNMLLAQVEWAHGTIAILVTHVTRSDQREREIQLEAALELFATLDPPAILLADLNTSPSDSRMERFLAESGAVDAIEEGGVRGSDRVDWILIRGLRCLDSKRIDTNASDHPLFAVRLTKPGMP